MVKSKTVYTVLGVIVACGLLLWGLVYYAEGVDNDSDTASSVGSVQTRATTGLFVDNFYAEEKNGVVKAYFKVRNANVVYKDEFVDAVFLDSSGNAITIYPLSVNVSPGDSQHFEVLVGIAGTKIPSDVKLQD